MARKLEVSLILSAYDRASRVINTFATKNEAKLAAFSKRTSETGDKAFAVGRSAGIFGLAVAAPLGFAVHAAEEAEIATKRLNNVFKQMGDRTGVAARNSADYASKLQMVIGVEDEEIMAVQAKIATFRKASDETARMSGVFDRATNAAFDLAAAGFGEASNNAVALGKALQDPEKGINALRRSGITFTDEERKKITALQKSGEILKAQEIVLKAIESQVKGTAKATATLGSISKASMSELAESAGRLMLPAFNQVVRKITEVTNKVTGWIERNPRLAKTIFVITAAAAALSIGISALSFVFGGLMKAISFASGAAGFFLKLLKATTYQNAALGIQTKLMTAATVAQSIATKVASGTMAAFRVIMIGVNAVLAINPFILIAMAVITVATLIYTNWDKIKSFFSKTWAKIKEIFSSAWKWIINLPFMKPVKMIIENWDKIKAYFSNLWEGTKQRFTMFIDFVKAIPEKMFNAGKNIVKSIWEGIKSFASKPVEAIKGIMKKIRDFLPFSPAKEGALRDIHRIRLVETISETIKPNSMVMAMRRTTAAAVMATQVAAGTPPAGSFRTPSINTRNFNQAPVSITYSPTIHIGAGAGPGIQESFEQQLKAHSPELLRLVEDAIRKNNRRNY